MRVEPFEIHVDDGVLADLRERIRLTRWPDQLPGIGWAQGAELGYLRDLLDYWADGFDWRAQERELNRFAHHRADLGELGIHFVHQRGRSESIPILLTHGWPSAFIELLPLVPLLTDPASGPSFDVVIPSLPGYGFSDRPQRTGVTVRETAALWDRLMRGLGYERYAAGGGDFGSAVATYLGLDHPESLIGIHLSTLDVAPYGDTAQDSDWWREEGGYKAIQRTKPQTVGYGLTDSPAGLAAWVLEKWRSWGDSGGDLDARFGRDFLLSLLTIYWATETITSSMRLYYDDRDLGTARPDDFVDVPTAVAVFGSQYVPEPRPQRKSAERLYDVRRWTEMPRGGHFAAREEPELLARDIGAFFAGQVSIFSGP